MLKIIGNDIKFMNLGINLSSKMVENRQNLLKKMQEYSTIVILKFTDYDSIR